uniref:LITAF domain-containing protein n=1 Tax=Trichobilharzia regenti TaxID=157069 RepID=A0AA85K764_TRIRE|nr:unnamed protein product [Trichobilharzia regenti]
MSAIGEEDDMQKMPPPYPVETTMPVPDDEKGSVIEQQPASHCGNVPVFIPGPDAEHIVCPYCGKDVTTRVQYRVGLLTWMGCTGIVLFGGIFGCCLIPFCVDACKDVDHYCPVCNHYLGIYRRC